MVGRRKATYNRGADNTSRDTNEVRTSGTTQIFNLVSQNAQICAAVVLTDLLTLHSAVIPQFDVTRKSPNTNLFRSN